MKIQNHVFPFRPFPLSLFNFSVDGNTVWRQFGGAADSVLDVPGSEDWDFSGIITL